MLKTLLGRLNYKFNYKSIRNRFGYESPPKNLVVKRILFKRHKKGVAAFDWTMRRHLASLASNCIANSNLFESLFWRTIISDKSAWWTGAPFGITFSWKVPVNSQVNSISAALGRRLDGRSDDRQTRVCDNRYANNLCTVQRACYVRLISDAHAGIARHLVHSKFESLQIWI